MTHNSGRVVDIKKNYAVVLNAQGEFQRISLKKNMSISNSVVYTSEDIVGKSAGSRVLFKSQFALAFFVMLILVVSQISAPVGYAVISLDINPSMELTIDSDRNVLSIEPLNEEATLMLQAYSLEQKSKVSNVVNDLIRLSQTMGYIDDAHKNVIIATALIESDDELIGSNKITNEIIKEIEDTPYEFDLVVVSTASDNNELMASKEKGLSLGKYAVEKDNFIPPGQEKKDTDTAPELETTESSSIEEPQDTPKNSNASSRSVEKETGRPAHSYKVIEKKAVPSNSDKNKNENNGNNGNKGGKGN